MSMGELAKETDGVSKGHLSNIEQGLVRPTSHTLKALADGLGVLPLDLLTFPWRGLRQRVIDLTRKAASSELANTLRRHLGRQKKNG